ncbi:hypothetical protein E2C01_086078 [Portunus trituberculatus]|uniref:Uncharacterized protein n=1 Tax=Portunus trituberculatus TaxID=210409 RepID=A0A5B7J8P9_PORTR|nr:hypothetical protein [Portunus trituberculatus]
MPGKREARAPRYSLLPAELVNIPADRSKGALRRITNHLRQGERETGREGGGEEGKRGASDICQVALTDILSAKSQKKSLTSEVPAFQAITVSADTASHTDWCSCRASRRRLPTAG